jgi:taurine dioxygenase
LVVRGQDGLAPEDQVRFCELFGPLGKRSRPEDNRREGADAPAEVMFVSNRKEDGRFIGSLPEGEMQFHIDQCYVERPARATCLLAIAVPDEGGDTLFGNLCMAYDTLAPETKAKIDGRKAVHVFTYDSTSREQVAAAGNSRSFAQPMVVVLPESGQKALYVSRLMTTEVVDMDQAESNALLDELIAHCERPEFIYRHHWCPGDLVLWDNRATVHARTDFDPREDRHLRRFTIDGGPLTA